MTRLWESVLRLGFGGYKRVVSPVLHSAGLSQCIFLPTCSEYAYVAVVRYGVWRGLRMTVGRVARCHPLGKGGLDAVP